MSMASLSARAASGAAWTYASFAAGRLLVFVGLAIVARLLGPEQYGLFAMAAVAIYFLEGSYDFGLIRGLIYFGGEQLQGNLMRTGFLLAVCLGGAISAMLFGLASVIAAFYGDLRVTDLIRVLSVYFGIACIGLVPDAILQRQLAFDRRFWPSVAMSATPATLSSTRLHNSVMAGTSVSSHARPVIRPRRGASPTKIRSSICAFWRRPACRPATS